MRDRLDRWASHAPRRERPAHSILNAVAWALATWVIGGALVWLLWSAWR